MRSRTWVQITATTLSGNSLRQTVHTRRASFHQAAKLVAAVLSIPRVTAGLAKSSGSLPLGLWLTSPAGWLPRTRISSGTLRSAVEYRQPLPFLCRACRFVNNFGMLGVLDRLHGTDSLFRASRAYQRHVMLLGFVPLSVQFPDDAKQLSKGNAADFEDQIPDCQSGCCVSGQWLCNICLGWLACTARGTAIT